LRSVTVDKSLSASNRIYTDRAKVNDGSLPGLAQPAGCVRLEQDRY
jgi:hypothetical protein